MKGRPETIYNEYVEVAFRAGMPVYMVDFNEEDQRNVCKKVTHPEMFSKKNLSDRKISFVMMLEVEEDE